MDGDNKKEIKWLVVLIGLGLIGYHFFPRQDQDLAADDLSSKTVTLSLNCENIRSTHNTSSYHRLWTKETKAAFTILTPGEVAAPDESLDSLKKGDILNIKYYNIHDNDLSDGVKEIPIYYLQKGKRTYFDLNSYNKARALGDARTKLFALVAGILMVLYGFNILNQKYTWIASGAALAVLIILISLDKI